MCYFRLTTYYVSSVCKNTVKHVPYNMDVVMNNNVFLFINIKF